MCHNGYGDYRCKNAVLHLYGILPSGLPPLTRAAGCSAKNQNYFIFNVRSRTGYSDIFFRPLPAHFLSALTCSSFWLL